MRSCAVERLCSSWQIPAASLFHLSFQIQHLHESYLLPSIIFQPTSAIRPTSASGRYRTSSTDPVKIVPDSQMISHHLHLTPAADDFSPTPLHLSSFPPINQKRHILSLSFQIHAVAVAIPAYNRRPAAPRTSPSRLMLIFRCPMSRPGCQRSSAHSVQHLLHIFDQNLT